jgi:hypothetical protein
MYHDTIHIKFKYWKADDVDFDYSFLISRNKEIYDNKKLAYQNKFSPTNYGALLEKFNDIGFNLKYLKFNDLDLNSDIFCTYNYQQNFDIFFTAYKKLIHKKSFSLDIQYGNIVNGIFVQNNMTTFCSVSFIDIVKTKLSIFGDDFKNPTDIIKDKTFFKTREVYQIIDKDGKSIANEITDSDSNFEQHFFEKYEVKVALRKYKLTKLNKLMQFEED